MTGIRRYQPPSSAQILRHVLERPELVAAVRELPGETLGRLIDRIGLVDAGEIIALTSAEQLEELFDHDLWRADAAGGTEDFQLERFGLWLEVLAEAGDEFLAQRLAALPEDMLLMVLHRTVLVLDLDALAVKQAAFDEDTDLTEKALESAGHYEEWEEFRLIVRAPEHWDVLWSGLLSLDRDHHALLRDLVERCAALDTEFINGNGGLYEVLSSEEMLENDLSAARADRRAAAGYVAPTDARAFLAMAARGEAPTERDSITRAYFRNLNPAKDTLHRHAKPSTQLASALTQLGEMLGDTFEPGQTSRRALPADGTRNAFERALIELGEADPSLAAMRREELAYLANVWIAGGSHEGRRPRPIEALELVVRVCNGGLESACSQMSSSTSPASHAEPKLETAVQILASTPCDRLFRLGYVARACELSVNGERR